MFSSRRFFLGTTQVLGLHYEAPVCVWPCDGVDHPCTGEGSPLVSFALGDRGGLCIPWNAEQSKASCHVDDPSGNYCGDSYRSLSKNLPTCVDISTGESFCMNKCDTDDDCLGEGLICNTMSQEAPVMYKGFNGTCAFSWDWVRKHSSMPQPLIAEEPVLVSKEEEPKSVKGPVPKQGPCDSEEYYNEDICVKKRANTDCTGPGCWKCDGPLTSTECVTSHWTTWKSHKDDFQKKCDGELVRWGHDSGVQDCGQMRIMASDIRACCDTCTTIFEVKGEWKRIACTDEDMNVKYSYGVSSSEEHSWSRTTEWSASVSRKSSKKFKVEDVNKTVELSASASHSLTETTSGSWSVSVSESTEIQFTQKAKTCSWHFRTTITDSCAVKTADSMDHIITEGNSRGNAPCCLPGLIPDETGRCPPDNAGNVVQLCWPHAEAIV